MNWSNDEVTMNDLYEQVRDQYDIAQPLGDVTRSLIVNAIYKKVGMARDDFHGCRSFKDIMTRIYMMANEEMSAIREPDEIDKVKRKFASIIKMGRIKPLKYGKNKSA